MFYFYITMNLEHCRSQSWSRGNLAYFVLPSWIEVLDTLILKKQSLRKILKIFSDSTYREKSIQCWQFFHLSSESTFMDSNTLSTLWQPADQYLLLKLSLFCTPEMYGAVILSNDFEPMKHKVKFYEWNQKRGKHSRSHWAVSITQHLYLHKRAI